MGKLTYNDKIFTDVNKWDAEGSYRGILLASKLNQKNGQDFKLVDAIDIYWNKAWLKSAASYISTTEDLIMAIDGLDVSEDLALINKTIGDILATYVTKEEFNSIISQYQGALNYGDHIKIIDDNTLIAYDVISNSQLEDLLNSYVTTSFFDTYAYTREQTGQAIEDKIAEIIGSADDKFDTIKEISDWIMNQSEYKEVPYNEVDFSSGETYYVYDSFEDKYIEITQEYYNNHPNDTYYVFITMAEKLENLEDTVEDIDERVGYALYDEQNQVMTYTGLYEDIHNLYNEDERINTELSQVHDLAISASELSTSAINKANEALTNSELAIETANAAYEKASEATDASIEALEKARYAYDAVGTQSYEGYWWALTPEQLEQVKNGELNVQLYLETESGTKYATVYVPGSDDQYYMYVDPIEATGMYKNIEDLTTISYHSLYNLHINNENSNSYAYLTILPNTYEGDPNRTIYMNVKESYFNYESGIIEKDGFISAYNMNIILTYMFDWKILPNLLAFSLIDDNNLIRQNGTYYVKNGNEYSIVSYSFIIDNLDQQYYERRLSEMFTPIDIFDMVLDGSVKYFIITNAGHYSEVSIEYIESHSDIQYYVNSLE